MYENPISVYVEQAVKQMQEQRENEIYYTITEKFDVQVNREELIKALQYDRQQYDAGYNDALFDYHTALTDAGFLRSNYGISDVDIHFLSSFSPEQVLSDYRAWNSEDNNG